MRISDWSSDVCSSDLEGRELRHQGEAEGSVDVLRQHAEHKDQQDADEEGRQRDADEGESEEDLGQEAAPLQARVDAQRHADEEGTRRGPQGELQRDRKSVVSGKSVSTSGSLWRTSH